MGPDRLRSLVWRGGRVRAPWRLLGHAVLLLVVGLGLALVAFGTAPVLFRSAAGGGLLAGVAVALSVVAAARWLDRRPLSHFGVRGPTADLAAGVALGGGAMAGVFGTELAAGWVRVTAVGAGPPGVPLAVALAAGAVLMAAVGVYEELLVRGYWLTNLAEGLRWFPRVDEGRAVGASVAVTAAAFGVMHAPNPEASPTGVATIAVAGLLLGVAYVLTGSLALPVGFHAAWNFAQAFVFGFPTSGIDFAGSLLAVEQTGPRVATGGAFGPEAGLVGLAWVLAAFAGTLAWVRRTRGELALRAGLAADADRTAEG